MMNVLRIACSVCLGSLLFAAAASSAAAQSQAAAPLPPGVVSPDASNSSSPLFGNSAPTDPNQMHMMRQMAKERSVLRQKEIVHETDQLLDLAKQLKEAVDKSNRNELSLNVVNTAGEIEKLAKSVKQKMRDGD